MDSRSRVSSFRICRWHKRKCFFPSCSFLDSNGNVRVCRYHLHPEGLIHSRIVRGA